MIKWRYITGDREPPSWALAEDEFLMNQYSNWAAADCPEPTLRIYTLRDSCALVGRFQNIETEVDLEECERLGVEVNRRITGGGAVLMGRQQLMVALASSVDHPVVPSHPARILPKMARGITSGLSDLGINAEYRPKNDVVVNGRKIGGTAICVEESGALLYQASVIVDFDFELMARVLKISKEKVSDKQAGAAEERMTTVNRETGRTVNTAEIREAVCRGFERTFKMTAVHTPLTLVEHERIKRLEQEKYSSDAWIYQRQPTSDMLGQFVKKTPAGLVHVYVTLAGEMLKSVLITGDFFSGSRVVNDIESALKWGRTDRETVTRAIRVAMASAGGSIHGIEAPDLADIIYSAVENARYADHRWEMSE